jgi:hypothetical protein
MRATRCSRNLRSGLPGSPLGVGIQLRPPQNPGTSRVGFRAPKDDVPLAMTNQIQISIRDINPILRGNKIQVHPETRGCQRLVPDSGHCRTPEQDRHVTSEIPDIGIAVRIDSSGNIGVSMEWRELRDDPKFQTSHI